MHSELGAAVRRRMRHARDQAKLTQGEVAKELGVSRQVVTSWESGRSSPNYVQIIRLCALYGVTTGAVLVGSDEDAEKVLKDLMKPRDFADSGK